MRSPWRGRWCVRRGTGTSNKRTSDARWPGAGPRTRAQHPPLKRYSVGFFSYLGRAPALHKTRLQLFVRRFRFHLTTENCNG
jgi:hypothetical protein